MLKIGMPIEVKYRKLEGIVVREVWRLGTISFLNEWKIGVRFKEGDELMVPRDHGDGPQWR